MRCGPAGPPPEATRLTAEYEQSTGRLTRLRYDADGDGVFETVSHMDGPTLLRIEIDRDVNGNSDGKVDRWEYYGTERTLERVGFSTAGDGVEDAWSFANPDGAIVRIEYALQRDGRVTRTEHYEYDTLVSAEEDGDADGRLDKWERYEEGRLVMVAFDTANRGVADRRLLYEPDGTARLEVDPDGDGVFTTEP